MYTMIMNMPEKFKIRISRFVFLTIVHDCKTFKCIKKDGTANISKFINNLLPTLLKKRDSLHKKIKHKLLSSKIIKRIDNKDSDLLLGELETILDVPVSIDYLLDELSEEIWIRPDKHSCKYYEKIWNTELVKYGLDFSQYIRFLLNDYCSLQQFKREELYFYKILEAVRKTSQNKNAIETKINEEYVTIIPIEFYSDYLRTNMTYLMYARNWDSSHIYLCNLIDLEIIQLSETQFELNEKQIHAVYNLIDSEIDVREQNVFSI